MADKQGKWVTINGRHVFIPKGKKLADVWDYGGNKPKDDSENYEDDLGESIYSNKHGSVHHDGDVYRIKDNRGKEIGNGFETDKEAIEYLENKYEDEDYEDELDSEELENLERVLDDSGISSNIERLDNGNISLGIKDKPMGITNEELQKVVGKDYEVFTDNNNNFVLRKIEKEPTPTDESSDSRDNLKTGDTAYYNGKKVTISTARLKDKELGGIQLKARDEDGHVYELSSRQLDKQKPSIDYDEIERRKQNKEEKDEMGVYLNKKLDDKTANKIRNIVSNKDVNNKLNYSPEMKKVKNAIKGLTLDSKEERRKLLLQILDEIDNEE